MNAMEETLKPGQPAERTAGMAEKQAARAREREKQARAFRQFGPPALLFGVFFAWCAYENEAGIAYTAAMLAGLTLHRRLLDERQILACQDRFGIFLQASLVLASIAIWTSDSEVLHLLDGLLIVFLGAVYLLHTSGREEQQDIFRQLSRILQVVFIPLNTFLDAFRDAFSARQLYRASRNLSEQERYEEAVRNGLVIAFPLLLIILFLLSSADLVFRNLTRHLFQNLTLELGYGEIFQIIFLFLAGWLTSYTLWKNLPATVKPAEGGGSLKNSVTAVTFLLPIDLVYLLFSVIQLVCVIGRHGLPAGVTYAEYVHQGFFQLCVVAVINLILVDLVSTRFERTRVLKTLLSVTCLTTYIMIASAAIRMQLYIEAFQLTFLRLFVLWFLLVLAVCLSLMILRIQRSDYPLMRRLTAAVTILYLSFALLHPDYWIARYDLAAAAPVDQEYLVQLSDDAVPVLAEDPDLLKRHRLYRGYGGQSSLRSFNLSVWIAQQYDIDE